MEALLNTFSEINRLLFEWVGVDEMWKNHTGKTHKCVRTISSALFLLTFVSENAIFVLVLYGKGFSWALERNPHRENCLIASTYEIAVNLGYSMGWS